MKDVILHAFNWTYRDIIGRLDEISASGFGAVLISPPLYSKPERREWWQRYQPKDYRILLSYLGDKPTLEELIDAAHGKGIKIYADIVLNHMANEERDVSEKLNFPGKTELMKYASDRETYEKNRLYGDLNYGLFSKWDFNDQVNIVDWYNRYDVQYRQLGDLPDLKDNYWILKQQRELFYALHRMGFDGFRLDAAKHLNERQIDNIADQHFLQDSFLFGEVLTTNETETNVFMKPYLSETHISAYDFPLQEQIRKAFSIGGSLRRLVDPFAYGKALHWSRAVTFTVNHDLPLNENFRALMLGRQDEFLANVYIMGRDGGVPLVYSDNNESLEENGDGKSHPEDRDRWANAYKRPDIRAMIEFHNAVAGMPMAMLYEHDDFLVFRRGSKGIVAINKSARWVNADIWLYGVENPSIFNELIHGYHMELHGQERLNLAISPRSAQMWLAQGAAA
ncbi:MAG: alpha-amylase [Gammaproteobacteria bacterium]|nr:MAG: alpha-amylase [Gammaproteobacteria bacterium]